jgi:hypothetical protein
MSRIIMSLLILFAVSSCNQLVYVHEGSLGVDFHASPSDGNARFAVGYDRSTYLLVPRLEDGSDAMSMGGFSRVHVEGIDNIQFAHAVATGSSAQQLAKHPEVIRELVKKILVDESVQNKGDKQ